MKISCFHLLLENEDKELRLSMKNKDFDVSFAVGQTLRFGFSDSGWAIIIDEDNEKLRKNLVFQNHDNRLEITQGQAFDIHASFKVIDLSLSRSVKEMAEFLTGLTASTLKDESVSLKGLFADDVVMNTVEIYVDQIIGFPERCESVTNFCS